jgi:hypothetical protein
MAVSPTEITVMAVTSRLIYITKQPLLAVLWNFLWSVPLAFYPEAQAPVPPSSMSGSVLFFLFEPNTPVPWDCYSLCALFLICLLSIYFTDWNYGGFRRKRINLKLPYEFLCYLSLKIREKRIEASRLEDRQRGGKISLSHNYLICSLTGVPVMKDINKGKTYQFI